MRGALRSGGAGATLALLLLLPGAAGAVDPEAEGARLARAFLTHRAVTDPPVGWSLGDAYDAQLKFVNVIAPSFGGRVGYKAALTSPGARAAFHAEAPVTGVLLGHMFVPNGGTLPAAFGARPLVEADLIVRVGDDAINLARTEDDVLKALDAAIPFLELPDLLYAPGTAPDGAAIAAANAGARHGVAGKPIPLTATDEWRERLRDFRAVLTDGQGNILGIGRGRFLMGDPLKAVLWLRDAMRARHALLRRGDLLSLGTLTPPLPAAPGTYRVRYTGLDPAGDAEVSVTLTP